MFSLTLSLNSLSFAENQINYFLGEHAGINCLWLYTNEEKRKVSYLSNSDFQDHDRGKLPKCHFFISQHGRAGKEAMNHSYSDALTISLI
jgi:hypothetical protein